MNSGQLSTKTLDLLAQYDNHISERDKSIEYIERQSDSCNNNTNKPDYDDLFKENIRLKLQIQEYEAEIRSLKKALEILRQKDGSESVDMIINQVQSGSQHSQEFKKELVLPTRSLDRRNNAKELKLPEIQSLPQKNEYEINIPKINLQETPTASILENDDLVNKNESSESSNNPFLNSKSSNINMIKTNTTSSNLASPATSVTYTTSRISIKSPNKSIRSPVQERISSPQNSNRITSVINNHIRSPLKNRYEDKEINFNISSSQMFLDKGFTVDNDTNNNVNFIEVEYTDLDGKNELINIHESPIRYINNPDNNANSEFLDTKLEFSPAAKARLNNFTQLLEDSFGSTKLNESTDDVSNNQSISEDKDVCEGARADAVLHPITKQLSTSANSSPSLKRLGSPVLLDQKTHNRVTSKHSVSSSLQQEIISKESSIMQDKEEHNKEVASLTSSSKGYDTLLSAPNIYKSTTDNSYSNDLRVPSVGTIKSNANNVVSEIPLFVQPEDFGTIKIEILSTLYKEPEINPEEHLVLLSVIDRKSEKEMFKFAKSIPKIRELDVYLKSHISLLSLPNLPERTLFQTNVPNKVALRREQLNSYFQSIFSIPDIPSNVSLKIAQFLSTDTVVNPMLMDDTIKEGNVMVRRPKKTLGNQPSWKIKYAVLNGDTLYLSEGDQTTEIIKLKQCTMEIIPNLPDDKFGTKNGFMISEHKKSSLSSSSKYYICTETSKERESWISTINELIDGPNYMSHSHSSSVNSSNYWLNLSNAHSDQYNPIAKSGSSANTIDNNIDSTSNLYEQKSSLFVNNQYTMGTTTASSPKQIIDQNGGLDEREARRLKMRSIFPFKKLNLNPMTSYVSTSSSHVQNINDNLDFEAVTIISQDSTVMPVDDKLKSITIDSPRTESSVVKTVFGSNLDECLKLSSHTYQNKYEIPSVVYRCLEYLYKNHGLREEGVFRLSGSSTLIKMLQERFDKEYDFDLCAYENDTENTFVGVSTVSGLLKLYLRSLPHSIFGDEQYSLFKQIVDENYSNPHEIALGFRSIIETNKIPRANLSLMYSLFELLSRIADNNKYNKMNLRNLCIVFSPTLNIPIVMLQPFIVDFQCIFKGEEPTPDEEREQVDVHIPQL